MRNPLARLPWFAAAPAFVLLVVAGAVITNYLGADYFKRTRLDEANPFAAALEVEATPSPPAASVTAAATSPATPPAAAAPTSSGPQLLAQGTFKDGAPGHRGSGSAMIGRDSDGKLVLVLEDFSVTNGPDLHVILSSDAEGGGEGIDLGQLKATDGTFSYTIPEGTDLGQFRSVTIFCASFPTIFAYATLGG